MNKTWTLPWFLLCLIALGARAESSTAEPKHYPNRIHLGAEDSWPPYSDQHGQGISTQLIKAAYAKTNLTPSFQVLPYARVLHDLSSGKIDGGYNVTRQLTTESKYIFGNVPLITVEAYWFFLPGTHSKIQSLGEIPDKFRVGVIRDYEYGDEYEQQRYRFKETQVSQQSQLIRMLNQGRIDAALMFEQEAEFALRQMKIKSTVFDKRFLNHQGDVYVAFSPKNPHAYWMAEQLDIGLLAIKETGEYDRILTDANRD